MSTQFRNLDFDTAQPMDQWPAEAIETIVDRGCISDWRRLARTIRRNPWGPAARTTEIVAGWEEHYGVDVLMSNVIRHAREDVTRKGRAEYAAQIRAWRTQSGMTLRQLAMAAGTSPSRLSAYENAKVSPTTDVLARLNHAAATCHELSSTTPATSPPTAIPPAAATRSKKASSSSMRRSHA
jgi:DNA-binding transcriptional regulator YiaG